MKSKFDARSYAAANTFPMKLLTNNNVLKTALSEHRIIPIHLQLNPTNKCNLNCPFCSCSNRDKSIEMNVEKISEFIDVFADLGGEAVTITGGGDPLYHKDINKMLTAILDANIKIGIVTNGTFWYRIKSDLGFSDVTWIRVSSSDHLPNQLYSINRNFHEWLRDMEQIVTNYSSIDWAFSHVVTAKPNLSVIEKLVKFANEHNFTHMRLVSDIFNAKHLTSSMNQIRKHLSTEEVDDSLVNYQDRASFTKGSNPCYISLLKPVLAADGYLYPCCGVQYALENPSRDYEKTMTMGYMDRFEQIIRNQRFFNGSMCKTCYYNNYNDALDVLLNGLEHKEFI